MLIDGHTHTEFCPHGSGDLTEEMILHAIQLGIKKYCITEHAPLPLDFRTVYAGTLEGYTEASMELTDLPNYMKEMQKLQKKYRDKIEISIGFEVDYLPGFEDWTKDFLDEYGPQTQESILSVHFMQGTDQKMWCVDFGTDDFKAGFSEYLEKPQELFRHYYQAVESSVEADLGKYRPQRIGHMSLVRKYQDYFGLTEDYDQKTMSLVTRILKEIKDQNRELDLNLAGLYKPLCNDFYPGRQVIDVAKEMQIPLIYGSDAHDILSVGHGIHLVKSANLA